MEKQQQPFRDKYQLLCYGGFSLPGCARRAGGAAVYHVILKFLPVQAELFDKILL